MGKIKIVTKKEDLDSLPESKVVKSTPKKKVRS